MLDAVWHVQYCVHACPRAQPAVPKTRPGDFAGQQGFGDIWQQQQHQQLLAVSIQSVTAWTTVLSLAQGACQSA
jgi:hypothetical protein